MDGFKNKVVWITGASSGIGESLAQQVVGQGGNVILSARYYENESPNNAANRVRQYEGLDLSSWTSSSPVINLQQRGVPEFTNAWTSTSKAMPVWGVNGLLQVIQPETLKVYNIDQVGPYNATLSGTVADDTVWIHTSTGCANVNIQYDDCEEATWIPALTEQVDGEWVYTGPATFTYAGVEVTASASQDNMQLRSGDTVGGIPQEGCSGISNPAANGVLRSVRGFDFTITLSFSEPVNNIPIRAAVLNSQPDLSGGDVYTFDTNTGTPNVSISVGCNVQVQGNIMGKGNMTGLYQIWDIPKIEKDDMNHLHNFKYVPMSNGSVTSVESYLQIGKQSHHNSIDENSSYDDLLKVL
mgnify:CR=1 FL=1